MTEPDTEQQAPEPAPVRALDKPIERDRKRKPFVDIKLSHLVNGALTAAIFCVAVTQCSIYKKQAEIMNGQQEVMRNQLAEAQAEQRAWVSLTIPSAKGMSSDVNGIRIALNLPIRNSGKNPAVNSFVNVEARADRRPDKAWQNAVCSGTRDDFGFGVFPGDQLATEITTYISANEIAEMARRFQSGVVVWPFIVACVVYKDAVTDKWHHTPYVFRLQMKAARPTRGCCAILLSDLPLSADDLVMPIWPSAMAPD